MELSNPSAYLFAKPLPFPYQKKKSWVETYNKATIRSFERKKIIHSSPKKGHDKNSLKKILSF